MEYIDTAFLFFPILFFPMYLPVRLSVLIVEKMLPQAY